MVPWYNGTIMNWIATNIRFPEDQYMALKQRAARERKSLAKIIREATDGQIQRDVSQKEKKNKTEAFMEKVEKVAKQNAKYTKGFDSVRALREIRYQ